MSLLAIYSFMLLQALHGEIEMKNQNLQVTLLMQKGVGTRSHPTTVLLTFEMQWYVIAFRNICMIFVRNFTLVLILWTIY